MFDTVEELSIPCPYCPAHKESKLFVNIEKGVFNCFRCGYSGKIDKLSRQHPNLFSKIEDNISVSAFNRLKMYATVRPDAELDSSVLSELKTVRKIDESDPHYEYLLGRGWTEEIISLYAPLKTQTEKYKDRVIIPVVDDNNKVVYFTARDITGLSKMKYTNPAKDKDFIFKSKTPVDTVYTEDAFICEGIFDGFKLPGGCSLLGKTLNKTQHSPLYKFLKSRKNVYICFDPGTEKYAERLAVEIDSWFVDKNIFIMDWVSDSEENSTDLGDISKTLTYNQLMRFVKANSHEAKLLKLI